MGQITVNVTYDEETQILSVDPSKTTVTLEFPDDWVLWTLDSSSAPPGSSLLIRFDPPLGPFQVVRGVETQNLIAKGNKGEENPPFSYSYFLYLFLNPNGDLIEAGPFTVVNQWPSAYRSPWSTVTYTPSGQTGVLGTVEVDPPTLLLHEGDVVFVKAAPDVPDDHVLAFWFPSDDSIRGPFPTYFVTRKDGTEASRLSVGTFGSAPTGTISYGVRIWNADGVLVAKKDPSIDNLGRPPGT
jgi:hypothetical protein